jgi:hypothetical protein
MMVARQVLKRKQQSVCGTTSVLQQQQQQEGSQQDEKEKSSSGEKEVLLDTQVIALLPVVAASSLRLVHAVFACIRLCRAWLRTGGRMVTTTQHLFDVPLTMKYYWS